MWHFGWFGVPPILGNLQFMAFYGVLHIHWPPFEICRAFGLIVSHFSPWTFQEMGGGASTKVAPDFTSLSVRRDAWEADPGQVQSRFPLRFSSFGPHEFIVDLPEGVNLPPCKDDHDRHLRNLSCYLKKVRRCPKKLLAKVDQKRTDDEIRNQEEDKRIFEVIVPIVPRPNTKDHQGPNPSSMIYH